MPVQPTPEVQVEESPITEWETGIATQTSDVVLTAPCTCMGPPPSPADSKMIFNLEDLIPVKHLFDRIQKDCFFDDSIEFDRFEVIGEDKSEKTDEKPKKDFKQARTQEITKILNQHPSLLELFQANTRC